MADCRTMKNVFRRETLHEISTATPLDIKLRKFQRELDDEESYSVQTKRFFMQKFSRICLNVGHNEMLDTDVWLFAHVCGDFLLTQARSLVS